LREHHHTFEAVQHRLLICDGLSASVNRDHLFLIFERCGLCRAEIEHRPPPCIDRSAQRPFQVRPGQPDHELGAVQEGASSDRGCQRLPLFLRMLQDQNEEPVVDRFDVGHV